MRNDKQRGADVAQTGEETVELRLVRERSAQAGRAVVAAHQGEVAEPGGPVVVEVTIDPDLVRRGGRSLSRLGPRGA